MSLETWELSADDAERIRGFADGEVPDAGDPTVAEYYEAGILVDREEPVGTAMARLNEVRRAGARRRGRFTNLRMALTERCNMACTYCFQQALYPDDQPRMSVETLESTVGWFIDQADGAPVTVQYFGGEPLLEWPLITRSDEMLRDAKRAKKIAGFRQTITTNGTVLREDRARWLVEHGAELIFSFDGPPEVNDLQRTFKNGRGTYEKAADGLRLWTSLGGRPAILMTATRLNLPHLPEYVRWFAEESGLAPKLIALNSPQPTAEGWETGGDDLAGAVFAMWRYCEAAGIEFQGPGTFIPLNLRTGIPQSDHCVDGDIFNEGPGAWPIYVAADGRRSLCLVHHNDHRVESEPATTAEDGKRWHKQGDGMAECDSCIASQLCGGPCTLERLLWGDRLSADRCDFMRSMTRLVITQG